MGALFFQLMSSCVFLQPFSFPSNMLKEIKEILDSAVTLAQPFAMC
jgi:hypothetical protein